jgi:copper chaperone CopZ
MRHRIAILSFVAVSTTVSLLGCASTPAEPHSVASSTPHATAQEHAMTTDHPTPEIRSEASVVPASWSPRAENDTAPIRGQQVRLTVHGMSCPKCANNITLQVERVVGVDAVHIDMAAGHVFVDLRPTPKPAPRDLARAVEYTGFTLVEISER